MIKRISEISAKLDDLRASGVQRGSDVGFECLNALYSLKQGSYTTILAPPGHGKTEFALELAFNQAIKFGKRSLLNTPETGGVEDITAELIHKYTGKSFYKSNPHHCDDAEYEAAKNWLDYHFLIMDTDERAYSFQEMFDLAEKWEQAPEQKMNGDKIDILVGDPWNELKHEMGDYKGRQDLYIEDTMGEVRRRLKRTGKHLILCLHPAHQQMVTETINGSVIRYYPMPSARESAGGQALLRKAFCWINIWRPAVGLLNEYNQPYEDNQLIITVEKAKPKGVATKGTTSLFFDWKRNRYYEKINNQRRYAFEHEKGHTEVTLSQLAPNLEFDDCPF